MAKAVQSFSLKWNKKNYREYLKSKSVQKLLQEATDRVTDRANAMGGHDPDAPMALADLYEGDVRVGKNRARGMVKTIGVAGAQDNAKNNTLLKALGGSR